MNLFFKRVGPFEISIEITPQFKAVRYASPSNWPKIGEAFEVVGARELILSEFAALETALQEYDLNRAANKNPYFHMEVPLYREWLGDFYLAANFPIDGPASFAYFYYDDYDGLQRKVGLRGRQFYGGLGLIVVAS